MFQCCSVIANFNIWERVRATRIADEHAVALGVIARTSRLWQYLDHPAVTVLSASGANTL